MASSDNINIVDNTFLNKGNVILKNELNKISLHKKEKKLKASDLQVNENENSDIITLSTLKIARKVTTKHQDGIDTEAYVKKNKEMSTKQNFSAKCEQTSNNHRQLFSKENKCSTPNYDYKDKIKVIDGKKAKVESNNTTKPKVIGILRKQDPSSVRPKFKEVDMNSGAKKGISASLLTRGTTQSFLKQKIYYTGKNIIVGKERLTNESFISNSTKKVTSITNGNKEKLLAKDINEDLERSVNAVRRKSATPLIKSSKEHKQPRGNCNKRINTDNSTKSVILQPEIMEVTSIKSVIMQPETIDTTAKSVILKPEMIDAVEKVLNYHCSSKVWPNNKESIIQADSTKDVDHISSITECDSSTENKIARNNCSNSTEQVYMVQTNCIFSFERSGKIIEPNVNCDKLSDYATNVIQMYPTRPSINDKGLQLNYGSEFVDKVLVNKSSSLETFDGVAIKSECNDIQETKTNDNVLFEKFEIVQTCNNDSSTSVRQEVVTKFSKVTWAAERNPGTTTDIFNNKEFNVERVITGVNDTSQLQSNQIENSNKQDVLIEIIREEAKSNRKAVKPIEDNVSITSITKKSGSLKKNEIERSEIKTNRKASKPIKNNVSTTSITKKTDSPSINEIERRKTNRKASKPIKENVSIEPITIKQTIKSDTQVTYKYDKTVSPEKVIEVGKKCTYSKLENELSKDNSPSEESLNKSTSKETDDHKSLKIDVKKNKKQKVKKPGVSNTVTKNILQKTSIYKSDRENNKNTEYSKDIQYLSGNIYPEKIYSVGKKQTYSKFKNKYEAKAESNSEGFNKPDFQGTADHQTLKTNIVSKKAMPKKVNTVEKQQKYNNSLKVAQEKKLKPESKKGKLNASQTQDLTKPEKIYTVNKTRTYSKLKSDLEHKDGRTSKETIIITPYQENLDHKKEKSNVPKKKKKPKKIGNFSAESEEQKEVSVDNKKSTSPNPPFEQLDIEETHFATKNINSFPATDDYSSDNQFFQTIESNCKKGSYGLIKNQGKPKCAENSCLSEPVEILWKRQCQYSATDFTIKELGAKYSEPKSTVVLQFTDKSYPGKKKLKLKDNNVDKEQEKSSVGQNAGRQTNRDKKLIKLKDAQKVKGILQKNSTDTSELKNDSFAKIFSDQENVLYKYNKDVPSNPPTETVSSLFPNAVYPVGQEILYKRLKDDRTAMNRFTSEEARELERLCNNIYNDARHAAEVHRQTRYYIQKWVQPGMKLIDICKKIEEIAKTLINENGLKAGMAFPAGCSRNNCAAHYTSNTGDKSILRHDDVTKIDFGTHVNGHIIDCAWTLTFNPKYDKLLEAVREATNAGIQAAGIDVRLKDIGSVVQEVMESYEIELDGKIYDVKPIRNLNGHSISPYRIHAGKVVPIAKTSALNFSLMEENEFYAIETLGSTGDGLVFKGLDTSHYMKRYERDPPYTSLKLDTSKNLATIIDKRFGTLAFCKRWLDEIGFTRHNFALNELCDSDIIKAYPPLCDIKGSYIAQFEHTIVLKPTCKEVISRGFDY